MLTEREYQIHLREQRERERRARGEPEPERGYTAPLPPNLTSRQKLDIANANFVARERFTEPPLTDGERGMSEKAFLGLSASRRLAIYNKAIAKRRSS